LLVPLTIGILLAVLARGEENALKYSAEDHGGKARDAIAVVLSDGPLAHNEDWIIKAGPVGPDNQQFRGTCSMIPADVGDVGGSGLERVTFEAKRDAFGIWKMEWKDSITGMASDGNLYTYQQHHKFTGVTTDGHPPKPNRGAPTPGTEDTGFLSSIPSNVVADVLELRDFFVLRTPTGNLAASSHVYQVFRLPLATDAPPPFIFQHRFILSSHQQLAGQLGCDPL